ncbi:MAG TPA: tetratricopeptide repeat protein [Kiritimatiellia bacterium]|nr:tetratricopeptide repeat protein [Kiritimatiellia bacterium]HMO97484.1 tetratricopeptide repeat protein [Kiritimatiellia bacterium]HMP96293.1 tetratricopeptide repeat protein [Kiritimatiellia bacterium]
MSDKARFRWGWGVALAVLAVLPYGRGLNHALVYDDHGVLVENEFIARPSNAWRVATFRTWMDPSVVDGQRPLVVASYFADRWAWGLWPPGYRLTNLLLHGANTLLVFAILYGLPGMRFRGKPWPAVLVTLGFGWHPLAVEAVQSPAFREDTLATLGGLVLLATLLRPAVTGRNAALGIVAYAFALLAKESAVAFPCILVAGWWCFPECRPAAPFRRRLVVALALITAVYLGALFARGDVQAVGAAWNGHALRGMERIWTPPWLLYHVQQTMLVPLSLSVDYRFNPVTGPGDPRFVAGLFIIGIMATAFALTRARYPALAWGLAWTIIAYAPVSNLVPLLNPVADRYAYSLLPGFLLVVAGVLGFLRLRGVLAGLLLVGAYLGLTVNRLEDWRDDRALWEAALRVEPDSARAHTWLGLLEKAEGNREAARTFFQRAETLNPHDVSAAVNLAVLAGEDGDLVEAERILRAVLDRRPDHAIARKNLELCLELQTRRE